MYTYLRLVIFLVLQNCFVHLLNSLCIIQDIHSFSYNSHVASFLDPPVLLYTNKSYRYINIKSLITKAVAME